VFELAIGSISWLSNKRTLHGNMGVIDKNRDEQLEREIQEMLSDVGN
jgi:hypothetical protein